MKQDIKRTLNKQNMQNFARTLCETRNGVERYKPLCDGYLTQVCDDNTVQHCVIGEMYLYFTGSEPMLSAATCIKTLVKHARLNRKVNVDTALTDIINYNNASRESHEHLFEESLHVLVDINDNISLNPRKIKGLSEEEQGYERTKDVQRFIKKIAILLK